MPGSGGGAEATSTSEMPASERSESSQSSRNSGEPSTSADGLSPEVEAASSEDGLSEVGDLTLDDESEEDYLIFDLADDLPQHHSGLDEAVQAARTSCEDIRRKLEDLAADNRLEELRNKAARLATWQNPVRRIVGIVGDSAAGKSSLINSLLNIRSIAHKGDHGSAVTSFITEYHPRTQEHTAPFTVDATFMDEAEIEQELHELLFNFRDLYRPGLTEELEGRDQEYREIERKSDLALATLESIFPGKPEISKDYLLGLSVETIEQQLQVLARQLPWPEGSNRGRWSSGAKNPIACHAQVAEFMQNGLWPLTYVVRVFLDAKVLETGLVLADLPGLRDSNIARTRRVEQYLYRCDQVFVVANINRAVTDQSVKNQICARGSELQSHRNVCVVCTHADEIDLAASEMRWKDVTKLRPTKAAKAAVSKARKANNAAEVQLADVRFKNIYTAKRNEEVCLQLKAKYRNDVEAMDVYCIGNKDYEGREIWDSEARSLAVQGSGVPDLRKFCRSIPEKANLKEAVQFTSVDVPDLLKSLELWVQSVEENTSTASMPEDLISDLRKTLDIVAQDTAIKFSEELDRQILQHWAPRQHLFDQCATEASLDWESYHHTQYKAWVRNNGTHQTTLKRARWNEEILQEMNNVMPQRWEALLDGLERNLDTSLHEIGQSVSVVEARVKDVDDASPLCTMLGFKRRIITHQIREQWVNLLNKIRNVRYDATGDHFSSYVLITMIPTYRACARENGTGMKARMFATMASRMRQRDIFRFIYSRINAECHRAFTELIDGMRCSSALICENLQRELETANTGASATIVPRVAVADVDAVRTLVDEVRERLDVGEHGDQILEEPEMA